MKNSVRLYLLYIVLLSTWWSIKSFFLSLYPNLVRLFFMFIRKLTFLVFLRHRVNDSSMRVFCPTYGPLLTKMSFFQDQFEMIETLQHVSKTFQNCVFIELKKRKIDCWCYRYNLYMCQFWCHMSDSRRVSMGAKVRRVHYLSFIRLLEIQKDQFKFPVSWVCDFLRLRNYYDWRGYGRLPKGGGLSGGVSLVLLANRAEDFEHYVKELKRKENVKEMKNGEEIWEEFLDYCEELRAYLPSSEWHVKRRKSILSPQFQYCPWEDYHPGKGVFYSKKPKSVKYLLYIE